MKLNNILISLFIGSLFLSACTYQSNSSNYTHKFSPNKSISTTNENWTGKYEGLLPCPTDCIGIKTELRLNPDFSYRLRETSLGHSTNTNIYEGKFKFSETHPNIIVLDSKTQHKQYSIHSDFIELRNHDGSEITTVLKPHYKMQKIMY